MNRNDLYNYMQDLVDNDVVIGMVSSIITKESRELFFVGESQENHSTSIETIYDLASVSKVVGTTSAILKLLEEGHFQLDTKVKKILSDYKHESTIMDLLTHQSGLPADDKDYRNATSRDEYIAFLYNLELVYPRNSQVLYSDFGFNLLGLIIEHYKGSIEDYLSDFLFKPLRMLSTTYVPSKLNQELIAPSEMHASRGLIKGQVMDGKAYLLDGLSGNAGLFSNINDLSNFALMLLNNGSLFNHRIFKEETVELLKSSFTNGLNIQRTLGYGLKDPAFSQGSLTSDQIIYHTGFSGPMLLIDFKKELAIINLCNRTYPSRDNVKILKERNVLIDNIIKYIED